MSGKSGKRRKPETLTVEGFKRKWVLETTTEQNKAMPILRDVLKWGEMALSRLNDTEKRPRAELLKRMQTALRYKGAIKERCEFLMACVDQSDGKDSKFDINRHLIHDLPPHAEKQFERAADFMLFGQTEETSFKSARSLLEAIKIDNQLEKDEGMCLSKRIQEVLDKMQLSNSAASSSQHSHISAASCTPASATVPEQASAPPCAGHAPSQLQQALEIAQGLCTSDLQELNQQCTKLLETRNGTTPMELEGEAAAGAASGKNKSPKTVRFAETPPSGTEQDDKMKAWHEGAWHRKVLEKITALKEKNLVDVETLAKATVDNLKSLPYWVAVVVLTKRMNETGTIKNEDGFFVNNCKHSRVQWDIDSECSADDESDDEEDSNDEGAAQHDAESSDHCASQSEDDMSEQGNADIDI